MVALTFLWTSIQETRLTSMGTECIIINFQGVESKTIHPKQMVHLIWCHSVLLILSDLKNSWKSGSCRLDRPQKVEDEQQWSEVHWDHTTCAHFDLLWLADIYSINHTFTKLAHISIIWIPCNCPRSMKGRYSSKVMSFCFVKINLWDAIYLSHLEVLAAWCWSEIWMAPRFQ